LQEGQARSVLCQPASEFLPMIGEVHDLLVEKMAVIPGAMVENNKFCLSVHFRCVDEKVKIHKNTNLRTCQEWGQDLILFVLVVVQTWGTLAEQVRSVLREYPRLRLTQGRKVLEIRPVIKWDKGRALEFLLDALGFADRADVFPIYIGDDRTDEDAFKVLRSRGQGAGILVTRFPKDTLASFSLRDPDEVKDLLRELVISKS
jgi:trehalose 6-phosphate phosphatase